MLCRIATWRVYSDPCKRSGALSLVPGVEARGWQVPPPHLFVVLPTVGGDEINVCLETPLVAVPAFGFRFGFGLLGAAYLQLLTFFCMLPRSMGRFITAIGTGYVHRIRYVR